MSGREMENQETSLSCRAVTRQPSRACMKNTYFDKGFWKIIFIGQDTKMVSASCVHRESSAPIFVTHILAQLVRILHCLIP